MELFKLFGRILVENGEANEALDNTDKKADKTSGTFGKLGGAATMVGGVLAGAVAAGAALAAAGIGGLFVASDNMTKALNGLQAQTGLNAEAMGDLEGSIKNIYKRNYGESFQDIADTMAFATNATSAWGEELEYLTQDALMLRDTFGYETTESIRAADQLMQQFGVNGSTSMAMLAEATQLGLNKNEDLIDTIEEYSVYFKTAGLDAQDMFGIFENASAAGVRNLDYVGDAFKEMVIRTKDGSKATTEAYAALGLSSKQMMNDFAAGGEKGKEAYLRMMEALNAIEDPVKRNTIGVQLFGTKFEDLEAGAVEAMANLTTSVTGSVDTLNEINEIKYDSFGEALQGIGRNLMMGVFEPFQARVMPIVNEFANWMTEKMPVVEQIAGDTFNGFLNVITAVYNFFKANILPVLSELYNWIEGNMPTIKATGESAFNGIVSVAKTLWGFFKDNIIPIYQDLYSWIQGHMPTIRATAEQAFNKITEVVRNAWAFFKDNLLPILASVYGWVQANMPTIKRTIETAFTVIKNVVEIAWGIFENLLLPALKKLWEWIEPHMPEIKKAVKDNMDGIVKAVGFVVDVFETVTDVIKKAVDWLGQWNNKEAKKKTVTVEERRVSSGGGDYNLPRNYTGTNNFRGGATWVGEHGPEIVELPQGSNIHSANDSRQMVQSANEKVKQPIIIQMVTPDKRVLAEMIHDDLFDLNNFKTGRKSRMAGEY
ncbi:phage tail tape measure protein [Mesobacillus sp. S13]|uniref:phage tail tape measure protein n=1 Tax=Mesobacillus sp. S13 TaxID=2880221 RepID=UPI001CF4B705|nr:phage tail tape measure protein [Mesobacillus sp. S13]